MQVRIRSLSLGRGGCVVTNTQHRAFDQLAIFTISMFDVFVNTQKKKNLQRLQQIKVLVSVHSVKLHSVEQGAPDTIPRTAS